jgi:hypothetical protein
MIYTSSEYFAVTRVCARLEGENTCLFKRQALLVLAALRLEKADR